MRVRADPIFWMHHCNVDRLYESWLVMHGREAACAEMAANQKRLAHVTAEFGELGFPEGPFGPFRPFRVAESGFPFLCKHEDMRTDMHTYYVADTILVRTDNPTGEKIPYW